MRKNNFKENATFRVGVMKKAGAIVLAAMLGAGMTVPVMAESNNYTAASSSNRTMTFEKYLVMDAQAEVPNVSFTYSISAGSEGAYNSENSQLAIMAGVDAEQVTMKGVDTTESSTIKFATGDSTRQDDNTLVKNYSKDTQKYAKKTATLSFSGCSFTEPGVYRYILTESASSNSAITNDTDTTRVVDVYVTDNSDENGKNLVVAGYVLHSSSDDTAVVKTGDNYGTDGTNPATKSQGFTNVYDTSDLTIRNEVSGNQASHDKYFKYTVKLSGAVADTKYLVNLTSADATSGNNRATSSANAGKTNLDTLTASEDGTVEANYYLQHGQEITIQGIAKGTSYEITENAEDYKSSSAGVTGYAAATSGTIGSTDLKTSFLNTRAGAIPTGVMVTVAPFAAVALAGGAGIVLMAAKRRKEEAQEA
jgi:pilin isopeptide linkage protein